MADIPVLAYHRISNNSTDKLTVTPSLFRKHLAYLKDNGYHSIRTKDIPRVLRRKASSTPAKPVILSFDDGYTCTYRNAIPLLEHYGFRGTFFICPGFAEKCLRGRMSWNEIINTAKRGHEIQSHTLNHSYLPRQDSRTIRAELVSSRELLERKIQHPVKSLAYPFGAFTSGVQNTARRSGYNMLFTANPGINNLITDVRKIKRQVILGTDTPGVFAAKLGCKTLRTRVPYPKNGSVVPWKPIIRISAVLEGKTPADKPAFLADINGKRFNTSYTTAKDMVSLSFSPVFDCYYSVTLRKKPRSSSPLYSWGFYVSGPVKNDKEDRSWYQRKKRPTSNRSLRNTAA